MSKNQMHGIQILQLLDDMEFADAGDNSFLPLAPI